MPQPHTDLLAEPATWPEPRDIFYGLRVTEDEAGDDLIVAGHPPRRRVLAACNAYARTEWGRVNLLDVGELEPGDVDRYVRVRRLWAATDHERWVGEATPGAIPYTVVSL